MRIFQAFTAVALLAATPCVAQVIITTPAPSSDAADAAHHASNANRQENAAQRDDYKARQDASVGNYGAAAHEQTKAQDHQDSAQHQEHKAVNDMNQ